MSKNLSELSSLKSKNKNLFEEIAKVDHQNTQEIAQLAQEFLIGKASITGTISFYDFLKPSNKNKKIYLCNGTACLCAGTQEKLHAQISPHFNSDEIGHMTCLGRCHENSAFHYDNKNYSNLTAQQITQLFTSNGIKDNNNSVKDDIDHYQIDSIGIKVLTNQSLSIEQFIGAVKNLYLQPKKQVLKEISKAKLRGRGGAGFEMSVKLNTAAIIPEKQKYIICNADEGDPGAYSDRYLLEQQPLLVLYGILVAGYVIGADCGLLYIRAEYPQAIEMINSMILKINHRPEIHNFKFKVISAKGAYICGEETALLNSIEGQRPEVRTRPPFPAQKGLFNKPTIVNNVETFASLYTIIKKGGEKFSQLGTNHSSGTKLISLDSSFNRPGIYEVEMGTPLKEVFETLGQGFKHAIKAFHIGGPLGGIVPFDHYPKLKVDFESFANNGFLLGHASVVCIPATFPLIKYLHHLFEFAAFESCGKCFPCRLGTKRGEELFINAINNDKKIDQALFYDLLDTLKQGSLCAHGSGLPLPVYNILEYFEPELKNHFK